MFWRVPVHHFFVIFFKVHIVYNVLIYFLIFVRKCTKKGTPMEGTKPPKIHEKSTLPSRGLLWSPLGSPRLPKWSPRVPKATKMEPKGAKITAKI